MYDFIGVRPVNLTQKSVESFLSHDLFGVIQENGGVRIFFTARIRAFRKYIPRLIQIAMVQPFQEIRLAFAAYFIARIRVNLPRSVCTILLFGLIGLQILIQQLIAGQV